MSALIIHEEVRDTLKFHFVENVDQVLKVALDVEGKNPAKKPEKKEKKSKKRK